MQKEYFAPINKLPKNTDVVITKPCKGSGLVILNKCDYIKKMENILADTMKFHHMPPAATTPVASSLNCRNIYSNCAELIFHQKMYTDLFVPQALNDHRCMGFLKLFNWQCLYIQRTK